MRYRWSLCAAVHCLGICLVRLGTFSVNREVCFGDFDPRQTIIDRPSPDFDSLGPAVDRAWSQIGVADRLVAKINRVGRFLYVGDMHWCGVFETSADWCASAGQISGHAGCWKPFLQSLKHGV